MNLVRLSINARGGLGDHLVHQRGPLRHFFITSGRRPYRDQHRLAVSQRGGTRQFLRIHVQGLRGVPIAKLVKDSSFTRTIALR